MIPIKKLLIVSLLILGSFMPVTAQAASTLSSISYANEANHHVTVTKAVTVYIIKPGNCEANNKIIGHAKLKPGQKITVSQYFMSTGGYIIKNHGHFKPNHQQFYLVGKTPTQHWFK